LDNHTLLPWFQRFIFIIFIAKGRGKINNTLCKRHWITLRCFETKNSLSNFLDCLKVDHISMANSTERSLHRFEEKTRKTWSQRSNETSHQLDFFANPKQSLSDFVCAKFGRDCHSSRDCKVSNNILELSVPTHGIERGFNCLEDASIELLIT
jgi:hypothetical protein